MLGVREGLGFWGWGIGIVQVARRDWRRGVRVYRVRRSRVVAKRSRWQWRRVKMKREMSPCLLM